MSFFDRRQSTFTECEYHRKVEGEGNDSVRKTHDLDNLIVEKGMRIQGKASRVQTISHWIKCLREGRGSAQKPFVKKEMCLRVIDNMITKIRHNFRINFIIIGMILKTGALSGDRGDNRWIKSP